MKKPFYILFCLFAAVNFGYSKEDWIENENIDDFLFDGFFVDSVIIQKAVENDLLKVVKTTPLRRLEYFFTPGKSMDSIYLYQSPINSNFEVLDKIYISKKTNQLNIQKKLHDGNSENTTIYFDDFGLVQSALSYSIQKLNNKIDTLTKFSLELESNIENYLFYNVKWWSTNFVFKTNLTGRVLLVKSKDDDFALETNFKNEKGVTTITKRLISSSRNIDTLVYEKCLSEKLIMSEKVLPFKFGEVFSFEAIKTIKYFYDNQKRITELKSEDGCEDKMFQWQNLQLKKEIHFQCNGLIKQEVSYFYVP